MPHTKNLRFRIPPFLAIAVVSLAAACMDVTPPSTPAGPKPDSTVTVYRPPTPPPFAPIAGAAAVYDGPVGLYDFMASMHFGSVPTRFVVYDDSTFTLQFSSPRYGLFEYGGRLTRTNSDIRFSFFGSSTAGPWDATGTLRGDTIAVKYNILMSMSDFVDGVYVRSR